MTAPIDALTADRMPLGRRVERDMGQIRPWVRQERPVAPVVVRDSGELAQAAPEAVSP